MKLLYIHAYRGRFGVEPICAVLTEHDMKIAPGTYYKWVACPVRRAELDEAYLVNAIVGLYRKNWCVYGVRKMWHAARREGPRHLPSSRPIAGGRSGALPDRVWTTGTRPGPPSQPGWVPNSAAQRRI